MSITIFLKKTKIKIDNKIILSQIENKIDPMPNIEELEVFNEQDIEEIDDNDNLSEFKCKEEWIPIKYQDLLEEEEIFKDQPFVPINVDEIEDINQRNKIAVFKIGKYFIINIFSWTSWWRKSIIKNSCITNHWWNQYWQLIIDYSIWRLYSYW